MKATAKSKKAGASRRIANGNSEQRLARRWKPRSAAKWEVVAAVENVAGYMGPDYALIHLADGKVMEVGAEGLTVYRSYNEWNMWWPPIANLTFGPGAADSPSSVLNEGTSVNS